MKTLTSPISLIKFNQVQKRCYVIEASAGTGKTWTLERLYIKALLEGSTQSNNKITAIDVRNILVVTFTKMATQELAMRIHNTIEYTIKLLINISRDNLLSQQDEFVTYLHSRRENFIQDITLLQIAQSNFDNAQIFTIHGFCNQVIKQYPLLCNSVSNYEVINSYQDEFKELLKKFIHCYIDQALQQGENNILAKLENLLQSRASGTSLENALINEIYAALDSTALVDMVQHKITLCNTIRFSFKQIKDNPYLAQRAQLINEAISYINQHIDEVNLLNKITHDDLINILSDAIIDPELSSAIAASYPICFIDEFQDTDDKQWRIFSSIYSINTTTPRGSVVVVGDPKQAIYSFRGADLNTYLQAKNEITKSYIASANQLELINNYRSTPEIIDFINRLFTNTQLLGENIHYTNIVSKVGTSTITPAVKIRQLQAINSSEIDKPEAKLSIKDYNSIAFYLITQDILNILREYPEDIDKIAILVNKNSTAQNLIHHLRRYNIPAITSRAKSIYSSRYAKTWYRLLDAMINQDDLSRKKELLATSLYGFDYVEIYHYFNESRSNNTIEELLVKIYQYANYITKHSFTELLYLVLTDIIESKTQAGSLFDSRLITDMFHIALLLDKNNSKNTDLKEILYNLNAKINQVDDSNIPDEEVSHLDQDLAQIKIMTQHAAKGLEFKHCLVVFENGEPKSRDLFVYSDGIIRQYNELERENSITEDLYSDARLCYVALTRAKQHLLVYYSNNCVFDKLYSNIESAKLTQVSHNIYTLDDISPLDSYQQHLEPNQSSMTKSIIQLTPRAPSYVTQSFSGITRNIKNSKYFITDESTDEITIDNSSTANNLSKQYAILNNKKYAGAQFGLMFHDFCECYQNKTTQLLQNNYNLTREQYQEMLELTALVYDCRILNKQTSLAELSHFQHELEFTINIQATDQLLHQVKNLVTQHFGAKHLFSKAIYDITEISPGFLTGFIDVFLQHDGKYYVIDYKTNRLDNYTNYTLGSSTNNQIVHSMAHSHYYLQYILYLVAIKRHLEYTLDIDDAITVMGGAIYLYVRGIFEQNDGDSGIYTDNSIMPLISALDDLFRGSITHE